jgi:prepilin-type N-terminal cleavage/methylation domain-containing protein
LNHQNHNTGEQGFSLFEMLIAVVVMVVITGAIFSLLRDTIKSSTATMELSDGQESLRTAQELLNRDLMYTGDGLNSVSDILVPQGFVNNYLTLNPVTDPSTPGIIHLGLITTDNDVPVNTVVRGTAPTVSVRSNPFLTDRISILQLDRDFAAISLAGNAINSNTGLVAVSPADIDLFTIGEIYMISSTEGSIFVTITDRPGVGTPTPSLSLSTGDTFGLNTVGAGSLLDTITTGGTLPTSISRMKIIHYYVNSNGLLMRRVFGVRGNGFTESVISEPVVSLQFRYFINLRNGNGTMVQPEAQLTTSTQQTETKQVEVQVTVETPHALQNGLRQQMSMTTSTSIRNMQFRQSLPPDSN